MNKKLHNLGLALLLSLPVVLPAVSWVAPAHAEQLKAKEGWYGKLVDIEFVKQNVDIPPRKGVMIIDSRPTARQYDPGHIPGAISIPDSKFDQMVGSLPEDKNTLLIFYCGGVECMLSHNSAFKAEKLDIIGTGAKRSPGDVHGHIAATDDHGFSFHRHILTGADIA